MATREFILKRIEGKEKEIEKLEKKIFRIEEAKASNWEKNPYYYHESDLKWALRDLENAKKGLEGYKKDLEVFDHKANSRNIQVILDFLADWKQKTLDFYRAMYPRYLEERAEWYAWCRGHREREDGLWNIEDKEERIAKREELRKEYDKQRAKFYGAWQWLFDYSQSDHLNEEKLLKDLNAEADRKYDFIIERTQAIVTEITDASNLCIGEKGDLNGYIVGTTGKAKVETIGAGGYNEHVILDSGRHGQRFHLRTLINRIK